MCVSFSSSCCLFVCLLVSYFVIDEGARAYEQILSVCVFCGQNSGQMKFYLLALFRPFSKKTKVNILYRLYHVYPKCMFVSVVFGRSGLPLAVRFMSIFDLSFYNDLFAGEG